jgi:CubicO group peptidase (beta-lactamase class C family)
MDPTAVDRYLAERAVAGLFSGVIRVDRGREQVLGAAYGLASRAWGVPCSLRTRFDTASVTKLFTAVATLQQVADGAFDLDTGVIDYLDLRGTAISRAVTPYHLLTHTSGIADDADEEAGERYEDLFVDRPNYAVMRTEDFLPQFAYKPPNFAPGERTRYCNCSYVLLGLMIERATGMAYRDYAAERVFAAAGMTRSGFFRMDIVEPEVAEGADPIVGDDGAVTGWHRNIYSYPPIGSPDGGAHVTADDLLRFHRALVDGALLPRDLTAAMLTPKEDYGALGDGLHRTGFGFEFDVGAGGAIRSYWKEGKNVGASAILAHYPAPDVTVALLSNLEEGAWEPVRMIEEQLLPG